MLVFYQCIIVLQCFLLFTLSEKEQLKCPVPWTPKELILKWDKKAKMRNLIMSILNERVEGRHFQKSKTYNLLSKAGLAKSLSMKSCSLPIICLGKN